ncbi:short-chain dehydrogenase/reductase family 42E member 1-like [Eucalyptus grandis]|uniref:short-chain dehydrogenase/reductase family 42E member 1-like n=1 Tax=Eucalyptus grandis TaxID=71139 RepID=UPI00192EB91B|nr:short-chain dehydrogenase/reductase family 42E member 1-like [Eucalyptus grandis]
MLVRRCQERDACDSNGGSMVVAVAAQAHGSSLGGSSDKELAATSMASRVPVVVVVNDGSDSVRVNGGNQGGDVARKADIERSLRGADCVFHLASYGMSGKEMLQFGRVDEVNINGTCHVLEACVELGIRRLVYVSTYNVVYGGKEIVNGNESLPYFPLDEHVDHYSRSKSIAEQLVLKSNGRPLK